MSKEPSMSVLADTNFLITLYNYRIKNEDSHKNAKKHIKYFLRHKIRIYLSTIVIAEFQQKQPITDLLATGNYITLPFNVNDAVESANVAFYLGGQERNSDQNKAKHKDDIKLLGQAKNHDITFIATSDRTLTRYANKLRTTGMLQSKAIDPLERFNASHFITSPPGQTLLIEP